MNTVRSDSQSSTTGFFPFPEHISNQVAKELRSPLAWTEPLIGLDELGGDSLTLREVN